MPNQKAGINQEQVKRQIRQDAEKLHAWPPEVSLGPDISALNLYQKAQLQRSHRKWPPLDLIELARVCKMICLVDIEFERYVQEGVIVLGGKYGTTKVENPRGRAISTLNSTITAVLRRLGIAAMSVNDKRSTADEAEAEREMREKADGAQSTSGRSAEDVSLLN